VHRQVGGGGGGGRRVVGVEWDREVKGGEGMMENTIV
jgi:hypothetical protein